MKQEFLLKRPGWALVAGAVVGGCLVAIPFNAADLAANSQSLTVNDTVARWAWSFPFATIIFGMGLVFIGSPAWMYLHHRGARSPVAAVLLGAGSLLSLIVLSDLITRQSVAIDVGDTLLACVCGIVGLTIQRIAYVKADRVKPPPAPPA